MTPACSTRSACSTSPRRCPSRSPRPRAAAGLDGLPDHDDIENVVVLGMGGSGIAGRPRTAGRTMPDVAAGRSAQRGRHAQALAPVAAAPTSRTSTRRCCILQAEADERCPKADNEQLFVALRALGRTVEYVLYPEEYHVYQASGRVDRRIDRMTRMLDWFDRYLGRARPAGSAQVELGTRAGQLAGGGAVAGQDGPAQAGRRGAAGPPRLRRSRSGSPRRRRRRRRSCRWPAAAWWRHRSVIEAPVAVEQVDRRAVATAFDDDDRRERQRPGSEDRPVGRIEQRRRARLPSPAGHREPPPGPARAPPAGRAPGAGRPRRGRG